MKLYGKAPLTELLTSTAAENRLPHAILLTGESGSGRRTIAKYIAKLFICGAPPCGGCAACNKIDQDSHPDVIYVLDKCDLDRKSTRLNSSHTDSSRMPSSA